MSIFDPVTFVGFPVFVFTGGVTEMYDYSEIKSTTPL